MIDLLVIGSGGAGLSAALTAAQAGLAVTVVTKTLPTAAQTAMAQGGINAVLHAPDLLNHHISDTLRSAHGLADPAIVEQVCREAPDTIAWLEHLGMPFSKTETKDSPSVAEPVEAISIAQRSLGGATHPRACYTQDYTGLKLLHTLYDRCLATGVTFVSEHYLLNLIIDKELSPTSNHITGATFWDIREGEVVAFTAHRTLIATGGYGELYHGYTTNTYGATGDGIATVLRAGGVVSDMEFIQFHPTAMADSMVLISEGARGAGGYLITDAGKRFVDELSPRDVVSQAIFSQIQQGHHVFLDLRHIDEEILLHLMPQELHLARLHAGVDPVHEPIPILPAVHYTMGGIEVDDHGQINNLSHAYAIGECTNTHLHGANRLGGNSLMEIVVMGRRSARHIIAQLNETDKISRDTKAVQEQVDTDTQYIEDLFTHSTIHNLYYKRKILGKRLYHSLGIVRDAELIADAAGYLDELDAKLPAIGIVDKAQENNQNLIEYLEFSNVLLLAHSVVQSAKLRTESRGAHYRSDFPDEDPKWEKHIYCRLEKGEIACS